jgi:hypothetical protein
MTHKKIPKLNEMRGILHFFGKDIRQINSASNMSNGDELGNNILSNSIFPHLNMSKTLGGRAFGPLDTSFIIIINDIGSRHKQMTNTQKFKYLD